MVAWYLEAHLAGLGNHVVVNGAAEIQHHPFLGPSWTDIGHLGAKLGPIRAFLGASCAVPGNFRCLRAHLGAILEHLGAKLGPRWVFLGPYLAISRILELPSSC